MGSEETVEKSTMYQTLEETLATLPIGSEISVISHSTGVRYEGLFRSPDFYKTNILLDHVKVLGTENRREGVGQVAPSPNIITALTVPKDTIGEIQLYDEVKVRSILWKR